MTCGYGLLASDGRSTLRNGGPPTASFIYDHGHSRMRGPRRGGTGGPTGPV